MAIAASGAASIFRSVNPATGKEAGAVESHSQAETDLILHKVARAGRSWRSTAFSERARVFRQVAAALREQSDAIAALMATEMGKPVTQGRAEVEKCASCCEFYAEHAASMLGDERLALANALLKYQPLGTVLAVMPWNFPFWQVFRCLCPVLMAGGTMVLKHASNVMLSAVRIEELLNEAGLPDQVFRTLRISSSQVSAVIRHEAVAAVTLTGSEPAGRSVAAEAGAALKPCVLELGGSDPYIVLDDADVETAARVAVMARCQNTGQSCIAAKRFLVLDPVYDRFLSAFETGMRQLRVGDPQLDETQVGPMARHELRDDIHGQVRRSIDAGARVLLGGDIPDSPGAFYSPTIVEGQPGTPVFDEETFGPVAAIMRVRNDAEAIAIANRSRYGLGGSVWSSNPERAAAVASELETGMVFVNQMTRSDPKLPFGGVKASGFGRELWVQGIRSFTNAKTVYMD